MNKFVTSLVVAALAATVSGARAAEATGDETDPWEGYNRAMWEFNSAVDRAVLKPVAKGYRAVTPGVVRLGIGNFFSNLDDIDNAFNNLMQGKPGRSASDVGRLLVNTTLGVGGLFDIASELGLEKHEEDVGQTLSVWGFPRGPYFVVPFMGPSTVTDTVGRPLGSWLDPLRYYHPVEHRNVLIGLRFIDEREALLSRERLISGDDYVFVRDAYLQRRQYLINDGEVEDPFASDF